MTKDYVRLVLSDLHLGSAYSQEKKLIALLETLSFDELILAGDIIEFLRKPIFTPYSQKIIEYINTLDCNVIYIVGNHDDAFERFVGGAIGNIFFFKKNTVSIMETDVFALSTVTGMKKA